MFSSHQYITSIEARGADEITKGECFRGGLGAQRSSVLRNRQRKRNL
jgi:hypothetical protein